MRRGVGELKRPGDIAHRENIGEARGEELVGFQGAVATHLQPEFLGAETRDVGDPTQGQQHLIEGNVHFAVIGQIEANHLPLAVNHLETHRLVLQAQLDAIMAQAGHHRFAGLEILTNQQALGHLHLSHRTAEALERLGQFATDRPAPSTSKRLGCSRKSQTLSEVSGPPAQYPESSAPAAAHRWR